MEINVETAQLILDAIAWANEKWQDDLGYQRSDSEKIALARKDFVEFCEDRGIENVVVEGGTIIYENR